MASNCEGQNVAESCASPDDQGNDSCSAESCSDCSDTDTQSGSEAESDEGVSPANQAQACQYYNEGKCRFGKKCRDLHVCKYFLKGSCRYGAACRLKHVQNSDSSSSDEDRGGRRSQGEKMRSQGGKRRMRRSSSSSESDQDDGRPYRWQLDLGHGWKDLANDHILEAQYSKPNTKGIKIYNTPCGAISIDFTKMQVLKKKKLRVRRQGSKRTEWIWHYRGNHGWYQFGDKGSKGKARTVQSSKLEKEFQKNPRGSCPFTIDSTDYEIRFREMCQKNMATGHRRKVRRRPRYEAPQSEGMSMSSIVNRLTKSSLQKNPLWQFGGHGRRWHDFKNKSSVSSADIEAQYQRNPNGSMQFTVKGQPYKLDFSTMTQTNLATNSTRNIQRL